MSFLTKFRIINIVCYVLFSGVWLYRIFNPDSSFSLILMFALFGLITLAFIMFCIYTISIKGILYKNCDPDRFLAVMMKNYPEKSGKYPGSDVALKKVRGLYAAGRFEDALAELNNIDDFPAGFFSEPKKRFYYEYLVLIYAGLKDITGAETALEALRQIAYDKDLSIAKQKTIIKQYEGSALLLNMAKGDFEGAEEFFARQYDSAKSNLSRVCAKYHLGEVYSHSKDAVKARQAFEYVAEHGNKLYIASLARENLTRLKPV